MSDPFLAEIRMFAGTFVPLGYALCNGDLLPIAQNTALTSILGTTYGGDGTTTVGLPDLEGRVPMHVGDGPGLTARTQGEQGGVDQVTLADSQLPSHNHPVFADTFPANDNDAQSDSILAQVFGANAYRAAEPDQLLGANSVTPAGGGQPHTNLQPFLALNFIIATTGVFPTAAT